MQTKWNRITAGPQEWPEPEKEVLILYMERTEEKDHIMMSSGHLLDVPNKRTDGAVFITTDGRKIKFALEWTDLPEIPKNREKLKV